MIFGDLIDNSLDTTTQSIWRQLFEKDLHKLPDATENSEKPFQECIEKIVEFVYSHFDEDRKKHFRIINNKQIDSTDEQLRVRRPDISFLDAHSENNSWNTLILPIEIEKFGVDSREGVGQAVEYCCKVFGRSERKSCISIFTNGYKIVFIKAINVDGLRTIYRTPLYDFLGAQQQQQQNNPSQGFRYFMQILSAKPAQLGYSPTYPRTLLASKVNDGTMYRALSVLGVSQNSQVFQVERQGNGSLDLETRVAAKVLISNRADLLDEVNAMISLTKGNEMIPQGIPRFIELLNLDDPFDWRGSQVLIFEPVGESLESYIWKNGPFESRKVFQFVLSIANVLEHAHKRQICHCDVRPSNIIVHNGNPVLIDWGIARPKNDSVVFVGTKKWAASDLIRSSSNNRSINFLTLYDYESLAYVAMFMRYGKLYWHRTSENIIDLRRDFIQGKAKHVGGRGRGGTKTIL